jgi:hypothetical protein
MLARKGERPPPNADDDLSIEPPTKALANGCNDNNAPAQGAPPSAVDLDDVSPISPVACAFGHEILLGAVMDLTDLAASYSRSASEAAYRGDHLQLGDHLRQATNALKAARRTYDEFAAELAAAAPA